MDAPPENETHSRGRKEGFNHYRYAWFHGELVLMPSFLIRELGLTMESRGGATVAHVREGERRSTGVALCNPVDNFNKATGRVKALGRALASAERKR